MKLDKKNGNNDVSQKNARAFIFSKAEDRALVRDRDTIFVGSASSANIVIDDEFGGGELELGENTIITIENVSASQIPQLKVKKGNLRYIPPSRDVRNVVAGSTFFKVITEGESQAVEISKASEVLLVEAKKTELSVMSPPLLTPPSPTVLPPPPPPLVKKITKPLSLPPPMPLNRATPNRVVVAPPNPYKSKPVVITPSSKPALKATPRHDVMAPSERVFSILLRYFQYNETGLNGLYYSALAPALEFQYTTGLFTPAWRLSSNLTLSALDMFKNRSDINSWNAKGQTFLSYLVPNPYRDWEWRLDAGAYANYLYIVNPIVDHSIFFVFSGVVGGEIKYQLSRNDFIYAGFKFSPLNINFDLSQREYSLSLGWGTKVTKENVLNISLEYADTKVSLSPASAFMGPTIVSTLKVASVRVGTNL